MPTCWAFDQFTPLPKPRLEKSELARPTPIIEPINACELEAGRPKYHVPKFQAMAATSSDSTISNPAFLPMLISKSTGNRCTMLKATAAPPSNTPRKFIDPDQITAVQGFRDPV